MIYIITILFQSYIYDLAGYSLLSELCAQMVLSVNIVDMIIDEMEMFENRAQAVEIIYKGVKRWSDKLSQNKVCLQNCLYFYYLQNYYFQAFMNDLLELVNGQDRSVIYQRRKPNFEILFDQAEAEYSMRNFEQAEKILEKLKAEPHDLHSSSTIREMRLQILKSKILTEVSLYCDSYCMIHIT